MLSKEMRMAIHNRFDIEVRDIKTGKLKQTAQAFNVICNRLWTCITRTENYGYAKRIQYGSGTGIPSASGTSLFHYVNQMDVTEVSFSNNLDQQVLTRRVKIYLNSQTSVGVNITEVGLGDTTGALTTHAMLQDMNGNPISIQKTDTDEITIYATIYVHYSGNGCIILNKDLTSGSYPDSYGSTPVGMIVGYSGWNEPQNCKLGVKNSESNRNQFGTGITLTPNVSQKKLTCKFPRCGTGNGNMAGIKYFLIANGYFFFDYFMNDTTSNCCMALIQGSATWSPFTVTGEAVGTGDGTKTKFKTKIDFPYNAKVYVNGTEQTSGVTVKKLPCVSCTGAFGMSHLAYGLDDMSTNLHNVPYRGTYGTTPSLVRNLGKDYGEGAVSVNGAVSDDLVTWENVNGNLTPAQKAKTYYRGSYGNGTFDGYNIIFDTPPANGDVITIDYTTDYIPKDSDHVIDVELTLIFGEYQEE